jgi:hypothetical protein
MESQVAWLQYLLQFPRRVQLSQEAPVLSCLLILAGRRESKNLKSRCSSNPKISQAKRYSLDLLMLPVKPEVAAKVNGRVQTCCI